jgi:hypothetical protein
VEGLSQTEIERYISAREIHARRTQAVDIKIVIILCGFVYHAGTLTSEHYNFGSIRQWTLETFSFVYSTMESEHVNGLPLWLKFLNQVRAVSVPTETKCSI